MTRSSEDTVRAFFACYSEARPEDFGTVVADDYIDYGHEPPGRGPEGARSDYEQAVAKVGGVVTYTFDGLVADGEFVAVVWTGLVPNGSSARGVSLYRVVNGLIRSTRHASL